MELREFPNLWRAALWLVGNIRKYRITVIVKIEDEGGK